MNEFPPKGTMTNFFSIGIDSFRRKFHGFSVAQEEKFFKGVSAKRLKKPENCGIVDL